MQLGNVAIAVNANARSIICWLPICFALGCLGNTETSATKGAKAISDVGAVQSNDSGNQDLNEIAHSNQWRLLSIASEEATSAQVMLSPKDAEAWKFFYKSHFDSFDVKVEGGPRLDDFKQSIKMLHQLCHVMPDGGGAGSGAEPYGVIIASTKHGEIKLWVGRRGFLLMEPLDSFRTTFFCVPLAIWFKRVFEETTGTKMPEKAFDELTGEAYIRRELESAAKSQEGH